MDIGERRLIVKDEIFLTEDVIQLPGGGEYEGQIDVRTGKIRGKGIYHGPNAEVHSGIWMNGKLNGPGQMSWTNKLLQGYFVNGVVEGFGEETHYKEGEGADVSFKGFYTKGKRQGIGWESAHDGSSSWTFGVWDNGELVRTLDKGEGHPPQMFSTAEFEELAEWLSTLGLSCHTQKFRKCGYWSLASLTKHGLLDSDLDALRIPLVDHRRVLKSAVKALQKPPVTTFKKWVSQRTVEPEVKLLRSLFFVAGIDSNANKGIGDSDSDDSRDSEVLQKVSSHRRRAHSSWILSATLKDDVGFDEGAHMEDAECTSEQAMGSIARLLEHMAEGGIFLLTFMTPTALVTPDGDSPDLSDTPTLCPMLADGVAVPMSEMAGWFNERAPHTSSLVVLVDSVCEDSCIQWVSDPDLSHYFPFCNGQCERGCGGDPQPLASARVVISCEDDMPEATMDGHSLFMGCFFRSLKHSSQGCIICIYRTMKIALKGFGAPTVKLGLLPGHQVGDTRIDLIME